MTCAGRGICGCGRRRCAENAWWFAFGGMWWLIAWAISERDPRPNARRDDSLWSARVDHLRGAMTDDEIDYLQEQEA